MVENSGYTFIQKRDIEISSSFLYSVDLFHLTVSPWIAPTPYLKWLSICRKGGIPTIINIHGDYSLEFLFSLSDGSFTNASKELPTILLSRYIMNQSDALVVNSRLMADRLIQTYGIKEEKIWIIPNGGSLEGDKEGSGQLTLSEKVVYKDNDKKVIFTHGELSNRKGLLEIVRAIERMDRDDILLQIAGKGPLAPRLHKYIARRGLADVVSLLGYLPHRELKNAIESADVCLYPTKFDGFNVAVLEAMQYAKGAVLASDMAGVTNFFPDELKGNIFSPSIPDMVVAMDKFIHLSPAEKLELHQVQYRFAQQMRWPKVWKKYIALYDQIL